LGDKHVEENCLDYVKKSVALGSFAKSIKQMLVTEYVQEESPDFLFSNGKVGVEHLLADVIFGVKHRTAQSIERKNASDIRKKLAYYHEDQDRLDEDISNGKAPKFIEDIINSEIGGVSKFTYQAFISNFKRVFDEHYEKRGVYRSKCEKLGFLIELPYPHTGNSCYIVSKNGQMRRQRVKPFPLTEDILRHIQKYSELDFVILCARPILASNNRKEVKVIYVDPQNVYGSVREQGVVVYDEFDYPIKFSNSNVVKLSVETTEKA